MGGQADAESKSDHIRAAIGAVGTIPHFKAAFDGLADAKVVANDADFVQLTPRMTISRECPRVEIWLEPDHGTVTI